MSLAVSRRRRLSVELFMRITSETEPCHILEVEEGVDGRSDRSDAPMLRNWLPKRELLSREMTPVTILNELSFANALPPPGRTLTVSPFIMLLRVAVALRT